MTARMQNLVKSIAIVVFLLVLVDSEVAGAALTGGILYPKESETREVRSLDGIWAFRKDESQYQGFKERWYDYPLHETGEVIPMPVPSSYNDITQERSLRDHVGFVWYERTFFVPERWHFDSLRVWLRFGSVHYLAHVFLNGQKLMSHEIGHLPFQAEVTSKLAFGKINRITVAVDNTLSNVTVPQGATETILVDNQPRTYQTYSFDFFNYAGIHRSVHLYTTPIVYIDDITINTDIENDTGMIYYNITFGGFVTEHEEVICTTRLLAENGEEVRGIQKIEENEGQSGQIAIPNATLWWPYMMHPQPGYMYTIEVVLTTPKYNISDIYRQPVGIRTVRWDDKNLLINGKKVYIRGVGKHEDSDIRGKGLDFALITKDFNLLKWLGINAFRTSHYPYAEEIMDFADQQGIMVIDECPSVDTDNFSEELLKKHSNSLAELIRRDKNRPSVIMWSIANEPRSTKQGASWYFKSLVKFVKTLETNRPITAAINKPLAKDEAAQYLDIISFNRYNSWYQNTGRLETIRGNVEEEALSWHKKYNKPVLMTEYGADTIAGLHLEPAYVWSEEYQVRMLSEHFKAFDNLREKGFFIGEMIWNFADFKTAQTYTRVGGNKKGILTRERQPKASAHHLRLRNFKLAQQIDNYRVPENIQNLEPYTAPGQIQTNRIEL